MPLLPATFVFTYNGVTFGTYSNYRCTMTPVRDEANRTTVCLHFKIQADVTITTADNPTTDTTMLTVQRLLEADGGRLTITGLGLGNMDINAPGGSVWDVNWGPKCTVGEWQPLGSNIAAQVPITIDTWIPTCADAIYKNQPMAFNYEVEWNITDGLTTRTISGYLEIPLTRWNGQANRTVPDVADAYRDNLAFTVPLGFRRRPERFRLSDDRKRLYFTFTDEEIDSDISPPPGAVEIETRQVVENAKPLSDANWNGTISSRVRGTRGAKRSDIMAACLKDIQDRLKKVKGGAKPDGTGNTVGLLIRKWRFWEEWYSREFGIDIQYWFTGSLATIFAQCGFWTTVSSDNWAAWQKSMDKAWSVRGHADLVYNASDDAIVDLCTSTDPSIIADEGQVQRSLRGEPNIFTPDDPDPDESWIDYRVNLIHHRHESTLTHKLSQVPPFTLVAVPKDWLLNKTLAPPTIGVPNGEDDVVQQLSTPSYRVGVIGTATRVKYRVPKPNLLQVVGQPTYKHGPDKFLESVIGSTPAGPIYKAIWMSWYATVNSPVGALASPPNHNQWVPSTIP